MNAMFKAHSISFYPLKNRGIAMFNYSLMRALRHSMRFFFSRSVRRSGWINRFWYEFSRCPAKLKFGLLLQQGL